jgi:hypothetical protein
VNQRRYLIRILDASGNQIAIRRARDLIECLSLVAGLAQGFRRVGSTVSFRVTCPDRELTDEEREAIERAAVQP